MLELSPPDSLKSRAAYRQAVGLLRQTSRAGNPDWYREAADLDYQWHLVVQGGSRVNSVLLARQGEESVWLPGPAVGLTVAPTREQVDAMLEEILATPEFRKARSLGVVIQLADEFATTEILTEVRTAAALEELREEVRTSPATVLGDPSLSTETTSTRVIPYAGAARPPLASTVTVSRTHEPFLDLLRQAGEARNLPVQAMALSAPLAFLAILPAFLQFQAGRPQFVLLHYPKFSTLAVFNDQSNLVQLRALPHRGRAFPGNLGDAVNTALDSLDLHDPVITILPLGETDPSPLLTQLHATLNQPDKAEVHILRPAVDSLAPGVPDLRPEMLVAVPQFSSAEVSDGFKQLYGERWALQDFLPVSAAVAALYPGKAEMQMLRASRVIVAAMAFGLVALVGLAIFSILKTVTDPAWRHRPEDTVAMQGRLEKANRDAQEFDHWENLLKDRSKGWVAMELLVRLFPEDSGVVVSRFSHTARLDSTIKNRKVGMIREWTINGYAEEKAVPFLNTLNGRDGMKAILMDTYDATGNSSFDVSLPKRNFAVSLVRSKNTTHVEDPGLAAGDKRRFPHTFDLKITQTFPADDPLAVNTGTLPSL